MRATSIHMYCANTDNGIAQHDHLLRHSFRQQKNQFQNRIHDFIIAICVCSQTETKVFDLSFNEHTISNKIAYVFNIYVSIWIHVKQKHNTITHTHMAAATTTTTDNNDDDDDDVDVDANNTRYIGWQLSHRHTLSIY